VETAVVGAALASPRASIKDTNRQYDQIKSSYSYTPERCTGTRLAPQSFQAKVDPNFAQPKTIVGPNDRFDHHITCHSNAFTLSHVSSPNRLKQQRSLTNTLLAALLPRRRI